MAMRTGTNGGLPEKRVRLDHTNSDVDGEYQADGWDEPTSTEVILVSKRTFEKFATETRKRFDIIVTFLALSTAISLAHLIASAVR